MARRRKKARAWRGNRKVRAFFRKEDVGKRFSVKDLRKKAYLARMSIDDFCKPRKAAKVSLGVRVPQAAKSRLQGLSVSTGLSQAEILERLIGQASPLGLSHGGVIQALKGWLPAWPAWKAA